MGGILQNYVLCTWLFIDPMIKRRKNQKSVSPDDAFRLLPRDSLVRRTFEADVEYLGTERDCWSDCFVNGQLIRDWPHDCWFAASRPELEGRLDDVLHTSSMLPVVSERFRRLAEEFELNVLQYLPVSVRDSRGATLAQYHLLNIPLIEALDLERSNVGYLDGRVHYINRACLTRKRLIGAKIWRLAQMPVRICVSGEFVSWYKQNGFTGIGFSKEELSDE